MTAKDYLGQAYRLDQRINFSLEELARLKELSMSVSSSGFEEKYNGTKTTDPPFVRYIAKVIDLEHQIDQELEHLISLKQEVGNVIDKVINVDERMVLKYRYIHNFTWEQIGDELNVNSRTVRRWYSKAMNSVKVPINPIVI